MAPPRWFGLPTDGADPGDDLPGQGHGRSTAPSGPAPQWRADSPGRPDSSLRRASRPAAIPPSRAPLRKSWPMSSGWATSAARSGSGLVSKAAGNGWKVSAWRRRNGIATQDIEYQAVLGRNWMSPWVEGGKYCGSRGMALPLLGLKVRLKGAAAKAFECSYSATFVDGSAVGPIIGGETCQAESLAAMEALQIVIRPRGGKTVARGLDTNIVPAPAAAKLSPAKPPLKRAPTPASKPAAYPAPTTKPAVKAKPASKPAVKGRVST